jgi:hypothetical protein
MKIGDLVRIISNDKPFHMRPGDGKIGIIVEMIATGYDFSEKHYYVYIDNVGWRYHENELELISNGSG